MPKKLLSITVKGDQHEWSFRFYGDPQHLPDWEQDGLEIAEVVNTVPEWVVGLGLLRLWVFGQDIFNFRNPFRQ